jgi:hypothetical protein
MQRVLMGMKSALSQEADSEAAFSRWEVGSCTVDVEQLASVLLY